MEISLLALGEIFVFRRTVDNLANKDSFGSFGILDAQYNALTKKAHILIEHFGPTRETREMTRTIPGERVWRVEKFEKHSLL